jgi:hypothetical protein
MGALLSFLANALDTRGNAWYRNLHEYPHWDLSTVYAASAMTATLGTVAACTVLQPKCVVSSLQAASFGLITGGITPLLAIAVTSMEPFLVGTGLGLTLFGLGSVIATS